MIRKIWIAYASSVVWLWFSIASINLGNALNPIHNESSGYILGAYIGSFIFVTFPLWIVFAYDRLKTRKEKLKHAIQ